MYNLHAIIVLFIHRDNKQMHGALVWSFAINEAEILTWTGIKWRAYLMLNTILVLIPVSRVMYEA